MKLRIALTRTIWITALLSWLAACNYPQLISPTSPGPSLATPVSGSLSSLPIAEPLPIPPETIINFRVEVPNDTPATETIYLAVLDDVTGLALNVQSFVMQLVEPTPADIAARGYRLYLTSLPFAIGSVVKYRYERQSSEARVSEHTGDGSPVRYRLYYVQGPGSVEGDIVSRWTDTKFTQTTGRITGQAIDAGTGAPIPNLLITAGGSQTLTTSNGAFLLEGLPPGVHNLVAYALDGSYKTFQQGARVASESATLAPLSLDAVPFVKGFFIVSVPSGTPPIIPVRLAGSLYSLGNTFATLTGGISALATSMPVLEPLPDGRYSLTVDLPVGADVRYKYTLGDGFWNAEHLRTGEFRLRQIIVPPRNFLVEENVDTWYSGPPNSLSFDLTVTADTPPGDSISIQFDPLFGWTEPIPMWHIGGQRWAYVLYSPLNLPGNFNYRYCRNEQCGIGDDVLTPERYGQGRPLKIAGQPQTQTDQVEAWMNFSASPSFVQSTPDAVSPRGESFWAGVEFQASFHPSWRSYFPQAIEQVASMGSNWLVLTPTWSYGKSLPGNAPPLLAAIPGRDMLWYDLESTIQQAQSAHLNTAIFPVPQFQLEVDEWWQTAPRDKSWWTVWFEQYRTFALHHADLANRTSANALILGGDWLAPALPGGRLADGSPSGVPANAEERWSALIDEIRQTYSGTLLWALPGENTTMTPPGFLGKVDQIYVLLTISSEQLIAAIQGADLTTEITSWLDTSLQPLHSALGKPVILALSAPSDPDLQSQYNSYNLVLNAVNSRSWLSGFVTRGFYPPLAIQNHDPSIHGKPTSQLLTAWFSQFVR
ncbi:MAG: hypothetical protein AB1894_06810 [Chloroflexota bacterium]